MLDITRYFANEKFKKQRYTWMRLMETLLQNIIFNSNSQRNTKKHVIRRFHLKKMLARDRKYLEWQRKCRSKAQHRTHMYARRAECTTYKSIEHKNLAKFFFLIYTVLFSLAINLCRIREYRASAPHTN